MGLSWLAKCTGYLVLFGEPLFILVNVTHVASDADLFAKPFQTWQLLGWACFREHAVFETVRGVSQPGWQQ